MDLEILFMVLFRIDRILVIFDDDLDESLVVEEFELRF